VVAGGVAAGEVGTWERGRLRERRGEGVIVQRIDEYAGLGCHEFGWAADVRRDDRACRGHRL
jgi:hypothetical protein